MNRILTALFCVAMASLTFSSRAEIMIEPYVSIIASSTIEGDVTISSTPTKIDTDSTGTLYGLRLGYGLPLGLGFGLDYQTGSAKDGDDTEFTPTDIGAYVSYALPVMLKFWFVYDFQSSTKFDDYNATGSGMKLGVGYTGFPFVSINLEYQTNTYDDADEDLITKYDISSTTILGGISFPIGL